MQELCQTIIFAPSSRLKQGNRHYPAKISLAKKSIRIEMPAKKPCHDKMPLKKPCQNRYAHLKQGILHATPQPTSRHHLN